MNKVFYNPETLEIKGQSTGEVSMDFPYVETDAVIFDFSNYVIEIDKGIPTLKFIRGSYTDEEWEKIMNK